MADKDIPTSGENPNDGVNDDSKREGEMEVVTAEVNDFFSKITKNDVTGATNDLKLGLAKVDSQDEHGMTPLMHAAYRGSKEMCELLLDHVS